jgi:glycosyltransferase involved in cell wall biosynthesis
MPRRLTILSDLRAAQWNGDRGIAAYSQSLVLQMCLDYPEHRHLFLWDDQLPPPLRTDELAKHGEWWLETALADGFEDRIDSLFTTCFFLPDFGRGSEYIYPRWLTLHQPHRLGIVYDLIPHLFPERYFPTPQSRGSYLQSLRLMREYDHLFAISQATRYDTIRHAGIDAARVHCVYGDIDQHKRGIIAEGGDAAAAARHGLRQPYALYIGGEDWRKNMDGMVRAFAHFQAHHPDFQLAIVCTLAAERKAALERLAESLGIRPGTLVCTGYASDEELVGILRQAEMMVFPSLYEGLGLPVLEAHGCGVPVVGSNTSSVAELVIPELSCDPARPECIAAAMERLHGTPALRARSVAHGRQLLESLGWKPAAATVMATLTERPRPLAARAALAVVAVEPPADSGWTVGVGLESTAWQTDFFVPGSGPRVSASPTLLPGNSQLPVEVLRKAVEIGSYRTVLFILNDSIADVPIMKALMQTRLICDSRRIAYLRDGTLATLLEAFLGESLKMAAGSIGQDCVPWMQTAFVSESAADWSLRFLMETGALHGLVVESPDQRDALRAALGGDAERWTIDVATAETLCGMPVVPMPVARNSCGERFDSAVAMD